jgi:50S ribosomal protein L16 3-hydroxylase
MLYLPPRLAHYGISQGNGQTYSIGFRAPSQSELMHSLVDQIDASSTEDQRYGDPELSLQQHSGEISEAALQQVRDFMTQALADPLLLSDTIGKLMTEAKYPQERDEDDAQTPSKYDASDLKYELQAIDIQRELHSRFAYNRNPKEGSEEVSFYAGGKVYPINESNLELVQYLTKQRQYNGRELQSFCSIRDNEKLLLSLWKDGHFFSGE